MLFIHYVTLSSLFSSAAVTVSTLNSPLQIVENKNKPMYKVDYSNAEKLFSPEDCVKFLVESLKGKLTTFSHFEFCTGYI